MNQKFLDKLSEWYGLDTIQRYEILKIEESEVLLFVAYRDKISEKLIFDIVRIFMVGDSIQISVDESADDGFNMNSVLRLIRTVMRVA